ncbi:hypothetical protein K469DRAFT_692522 [Zopfia rhizophila CBS 207.26]|uniref:Uracil-DNA glycosylase-like domain-containing protein n=1 Tax=Zopfia rhizophila CBS 207.26 TaxID=1314779 RepID=A0A6A6DTL1_9PEZI|nr:hypothetical protein K469DRAFT_692522 [Zopfia rhizophila CBS 207.26]
MEQLTAGLSNVTLGLEAANTYEQAFDKIVLFAEKARGYRIQPDELAVTKNFAGPFTHGGLFILLLEPRPYHPWSEGVNAVISNCDSLDSLNEAVQIGSKRALSLINDVSVIDLRPFLVKAHHPTLRGDEWEELYDLIFSAIKAKQPDVLLCMGNEAMNALEARKNAWQADSWQCIQLVYAIHPSHSVNHNKNHAKKRKELLRSICEACEKLNHRWDEGSWEERFLNGELSIPQAVPASESRFTLSKDTKCVESFLEVILILCFPPQYHLPSLSIVPGVRYYDLQNWHKKWFRHMERYRDATHDLENHARALLIPVFKQLNRSFRRTSWFLPTYEVDWVSVRRAFTGLPLEFEYACYLLAGDTEGDMDRAASRMENGPEHKDGNNSHVFTRVEKITAHATKHWERGQPHPPRTSHYVGFTEEQLFMCTAFCHHSSVAGTVDILAAAVSDRRGRIRTGRFIKLVSRERKGQPKMKLIRRWILSNDFSNGAFRVTGLCSITT